jgi:hypothetical protein
MKFCFKLNKTATETYMVQNVYVMETMNKTETSEWFLKFQCEISFVENTKCLGKYVFILTEMYIRSSSHRDKL